MLSDSVTAGRAARLLNDLSCQAAAHLGLSPDDLRQQLEDDPAAARMALRLARRYVDVLTEILLTRTSRRSEQIDEYAGQQTGLLAAAGSLADLLDKALDDPPLWQPPPDMLPLPFAHHDNPGFGDA